MTVRQLIIQLQQYPSDALVYVPISDGQNGTVQFVARLPHLCRWFTHHRWEDSPMPKKRDPFLDGDAP